MKNYLHILANCIVYRTLLTNTLINCSWFATFLTRWKRFLLLCNYFYFGVISKENTVIFYVQESALSRSTCPIFHHPSIISSLHHSIMYYVFAWGNSFPHTITKHIVLRASKIPGCIGKTQTNNIHHVQRYYPSWLHRRWYTGLVFPIKENKVCNNFFKFTFIINCIY